MQIKSDKPLQLQVTEPKQTKLQVEPRKLTPAEKLKAYQPAIHSGELMVDAPIGTEFGAQKIGVKSLGRVTPSK
jgi:hypothetical protein